MFYLSNLVDQFSDEQKDFPANSHLSFAISYSSKPLLDLLYPVVISMQVLLLKFHNFHPKVLQQYPIEIQLMLYVNHFAMDMGLYNDDNQPRVINNIFFFIFNRKLKIKMLYDIIKKSYIIEKIKRKKKLSY